MPFSALNLQNNPELYFDRRSKIYFPKEYYQNKVNYLSIYTCPVCNYQDMNVETYQQHLYSMHGLSVCQNCVMNKPIFPAFQAVYPLDRLREHTSECMISDDGMDGGMLSQQLYEQQIMMQGGMAGMNSKQRGRKPTFDATSPKFEEEFPSLGATSTNKTPTPNKTTPGSGSSSNLTALQGQSSPPQAQNQSQDQAFGSQLLYQQPQQSLLFDKQSEVGGRSGLFDAGNTSTDNSSLFSSMLGTGGTGTGTNDPLQQNIGNVRGNDGSLISAFGLNGDGNTSDISSNNQMSSFLGGLLSETPSQPQNSLLSGLSGGTMDSSLAGMFSGSQNQAIATPPRSVSNGSMPLSQTSGGSSGLNGSLLFDSFSGGVQQNSDRNSPFPGQRNTSNNNGSFLSRVGTEAAI